MNQVGEFDWNPEEQGIVLGSFYYGFIITQIPGGILCEKLGSKWIIGLATFVSGILTILNPLAARIGGIAGISTLRAVQGLFQVNYTECVTDLG